MREEEEERQVKIMMLSVPSNYPTGKNNKEASSLSLGDVITVYYELGELFCERMTQYQEARETMPKAAPVIYKTMMSIKRFRDELARQEICLNLNVDTSKE